MKLMCDRDALLDAITLVSGAVATRSPKPQLGCVHLVADNEGDTGALRLAATDAEISLALATERVEVQGPGQALIPADRIRAIVQAEDQDGELTVEIDGNDCTISGADAHFTVFGYPPADFPGVPRYQDVVSGSDSGTPKAVFNTPAETLTRVIQKTLFAVARETSRYAINGVLLKRSGKTIELVSTDGRRLARCVATIADADKSAEPISCIVPTKALNMVLRLASDPDEQVHVAITDTRAVFAFGDPGAPGGPRATLATVLVEGTFPPYEDVIPKDQDKRATFDRDVLASAVKRAALLTNEESRGVRLAFKAETKQLEISSRAPEMGESTITVDLPAYDGDDLEIGFNPQFVSDVLKVVADPQVVLELKSPNKPGLIKAGDDFLYVVMPVNLP